MMINLSMLTYSFRMPFSTGVCSPQIHPEIWKSRRLIIFSTKDCVLNFHKVVSLFFVVLLIMGHFTEIEGSCDGSGRSILTSLEGNISDGTSSYPTNTQCEWLIEAPSNKSKIVLNFTSVKTECTFDFIFVFDGDSYASPLIASISGDNQVTDIIVAQSGKMLIMLYSDTNYQLDGFHAIYHIQNCILDCSGHGICSDDNTCECDDGFVGEWCQEFRCPDDCNPPNGQCNVESNICECSAGFIGVSCTLNPSNIEGCYNYYLISSSVNNEFVGRVGHAGQFHQHTNSLWIFGGFDLYTALSSMDYYNFTSNKWQSVLYESNSNIPDARYGHTMTLYNDNLIIFGGSLSNGTLLNDLWQFSVISMEWTLLDDGVHSLAPPSTTDHTAVLVHNTTLYIFGGYTSTNFGINNMYKYDFSSHSGWQEVIPRGGHIQEVGVTGHSCVYHADYNSLIVFGGLRKFGANHSMRKTNDIYLFHLEQLYWRKLDLKDIYSPRQRAFHTANIVGNYMVVYGGYTHDHVTSRSNDPDAEVCYSSDISLFHLGCFQWVSWHDIVQDFSQNTDFNLLRGRFGHIASVRDDSILLIAGGYRGIVLKDLIALKMPQSNLQNKASHCVVHNSEETCLVDLDCVWCNNSCISYSERTNCMLIEEPSCTGICSSLTSCESCLIWGQGSERVTVGCGWCVQVRSCKIVNELSGTCDDNERPTPWWGSTTLLLGSFEQCRVQDKPAGITLIQYRHPYNESHPDQVSILDSSSSQFTFSGDISGGLLTGKAVFIGRIHPLGSSGRNVQDPSVWLKTSHADATLYISTDATQENEEIVAYINAHSSINAEVEAKRGSGDAVLPMSPANGVYYACLKVEQQISTSTTPSSMEISWDGYLEDSSYISDKIHVEFLEPFHSSVCDRYITCLACLSDASCGWCSSSNTCLLRNQSVCDSQGNTYMITNFEHCEICSNYVNCFDCLSNLLCEWLPSTIQCVRRGRFEESIVNDDQCLSLCHQRTNCSACTSATNECMWCEDTQLCIPFRAYTSIYKFGQCKHWYSNEQQCPHCFDFNTCSNCLESFRCGWCGNENNPTLGNCHTGDFSGPFSKMTCESLVASEYNISSNEPADWSYAICPPVEECRLGLDNCLTTASCVETYESFYCECFQGFQGDGVLECNKTCYYDCGYGYCSGPPDYDCVCDVGWTGVNCSINCGCNNHSTCVNGTGSCDQCQDWIMGEYCELCVAGSYGNATTQFGCHECACNGHGDPNSGHCDNSTGICFCIDNTQGDYCQECVDNYYGNPSNGGKCYLECQEKLVITNLTSSTLGSHEGDGAKNPLQTNCVWILTVYDDLVNPSPLTSVPTISLYIEEISLFCGRDYVYVYEGLPSFMSNTSMFSSVHLASFCEANTLEKHIVVQAKSGIMSVVFEGDTSNTSPSDGFKAIFTVNDCPSDCVGNRQCVNGDCICQNDFVGANCDIELCPFNCSYNYGQGICNEDLGLCVCINGFGGEDCARNLSANNHAVWTPLFKPSILTPSVDDVFPSGVMGHSMAVSESHDSLIIFGGFSFAEDASVNSLWSYNLTSSSWNELSKNQVLKPSARHFHAAAYSNYQMYISGGIGESGVLNDFWAYNVSQNTWTELQTVLPLAGHTLTAVDDEVFLIGGYSPEGGFLNKLWVYNIPTGEWLERTSQGTPPIGLYGHSTVYHEDTDALYVFGGYRFSLDLAYASNKLYSFRPNDSYWSILPVKTSNSPFSHVFHSAVTIGDYMLVIGGSTENHNISSSLIAYSYHCNYWFDLTHNNFTVGHSPLPSSSMVAVVTDANTIYVHGGYNGVTNGGLYSLHIPDNLCAIYDDHFDECLEVPGCSACITNSTSKCLAADSLSCSGQFDTFVTGEISCYDNIVNRNCIYSESCSECLAIFPAHINADQNCQWCMNCTEAKCVKQNSKCPRLQQCKLTTPSERRVTLTSDCITCEASTCETCLENQSGCMWTRQYERTGMITYTLHREPESTWNCFQEALKSYVPVGFPFKSSPPDPCPTKCYEHKSCSTCLDSTGADGGINQCVWSRWLNECLSPTYMLLRCASGECGAVISESSSRCPTPCNMYTICAECISNPGCGWCSIDDENGIGVCMEGGLFSPSNDICQASTIGVTSGLLPAYMANHTDVSQTTWSFLECPPENECLNGHNECGATQQCNDTRTAYLCTCKYGYEPISSDTCIPVCVSPCIHGSCILPNVCECEFGFIGGDCSMECNCNGHSQCSGADESGVNDCLHCEHNTMGINCEYCKALFVGDPRDGGTCTNCTTYCHGNSDICLTEQEYNATVIAGLVLTPELVFETFLQGPLENAVCVNCSEYSSGKTCDTCIDGYFKENGICRLCNCNGHWSTCNKETGLDCKCDNNTRTPQCPDSILQEPCFPYQCSKCNERYVGVPTDGHQCYLEMKVQQDYCFWSQTQCPINPEPLPYGRSSFYAVQPKFKNLDIRMTIDVTYGKLDVYVAFNHSIFTIDVNETTGIHSVSIDGVIQYGSNRQRRDTNSDLYTYYEVTATGLNTFITVETSQFVVVVFDVQNRLVITFPYVNHPLETGKFFVTLLGMSSERDNTTQGIMHFYQDQLHIDLFVFFSVFLACFFLLLAFCVIVWQAKSGFEQHRNHQERLIQMETMASRPFGKVMVIIDDDNGQAERNLLLQNQNKNFPPPLVRREEYNFQPGVMTSEMIDDGMASIGTLIFTLPGNDIPTRACLGSALLTVKPYTSLYLKGNPPVVSQKAISARDPQHCEPIHLPRQVWHT